MNKTYEYNCKCGYHKEVSEVEAYKTGSHTKCNKCGEIVTIYITFHPVTGNHTVIKREW